METHPIILYYYDTIVIWSLILFKWHRTTRMTGPDCAVRYNSINIYTNTHTHTRSVDDDHMDIHRRQIKQYNSRVALYS